VAVQRSRVRAADGSGELPVAAYELFSQTEILGRLALERMLGGLSTRRYGLGLEPVGARVEQTASATSKSAVSRRFVAMTHTALTDLLDADLSALDLVCLMVDVRATARSLRARSARTPTITRQHSRPSSTPMLNWIPSPTGHVVPVRQVPLQNAYRSACHCSASRVMTEALSPAAAPNNRSSAGMKSRLDSPVQVQRPSRLDLVLPVGGTRSRGRVTAKGALELAGTLAGREREHLDVVAQRRLVKALQHDLQQDMVHRFPLFAQSGELSTWRSYGRCYRTAGDAHLVIEGLAASSLLAEALRCIELAASNRNLVPMPERVDRAV